MTAFAFKQCRCVGQWNLFDKGGIWLILLGLRPQQHGAWNFIFVWTIMLVFDIIRWTPPLRCQCVVASPCWSVAHPCYQSVFDHASSQCLCCAGQCWWWALRAVLLVSRVGSCRSYWCFAGPCWFMQVRAGALLVRLESCRSVFVLWWSVLVRAGPCRVVVSCVGGSWLAANVSLRYRRLRRTIDSVDHNREIGFGFVSCSCRACERAGEARRSCVGVRESNVSQRWCPER